MHFAVKNCAIFHLAQIIYIRTPEPTNIFILLRGYHKYMENDINVYELHTIRCNRNEFEMACSFGYISTVK